jgi:hypothetical protein
MGAGKVMTEQLGNSNSVKSLNSPWMWWYSLWSQQSGGWGSSLRPAWATQWDPVSKKTNKIWILSNVGMLPIITKSISNLVLCVCVCVCVCMCVFPSLWLYWSLNSGHVFYHLSHAPSSFFVVFFFKLFSGRILNFVWGWPQTFILLCRPPT